MSTAQTTKPAVPAEANPAPAENGGNLKASLIKFFTGWLARQESVVIVLLLSLGAQGVGIWRLYQDSRSDAKAARDEFRAMANEQNDRWKSEGKELRETLTHELRNGFDRVIDRIERTK